MRPLRGQFRHTVTSDVACAGQRGRRLRDTIPTLSHAHSRRHDCEQRAATHNLARNYHGSPLRSCRHDCDPSVHCTKPPTHAAVCAAATPPLLSTGSPTQVIPGLRVTPRHTLLLHAPPRVRSDLRSVLLLAASAPLFCYLFLLSLSLTDSLRLCSALLLPAPLFCYLILPYSLRS